MVNSLVTLENSSEGRESQSRLSLETKSTETLGLVLISYKIFLISLVLDEIISDSLVSVMSR